MLTVKYCSTLKVTIVLCVHQNFQTYSSGGADPGINWFHFLNDTTKFVSFTKSVLRSLFNISCGSSTKFQNEKAILINDSISPTKFFLGKCIIMHNSCFDNNQRKFNLHVFRPISKLRTCTNFIGQPFVNSIKLYVCLQVEIAGAFFGSLTSTN